MYYCYDFFDTIVHRDCGSEEILYFWAKEMSIYVDFTVSAQAFYDCRKTMEIDGKLTLNKEEITYSELIEKVYYYFIDILCDVVSFSSFLDYSFKMECVHEEKHIYLDECISKEIKEVSCSNKLILISDFYLGNEFFITILKNYNLYDCFDHIYVSSDIGFRKSTSNLYKEVKRQLHTDFSKMKMKGDNLESDYRIPIKLGMSAEIYINDFKNKEKKEKHFDKEAKRLFFSDYQLAPFNGYIAEISFFISNLYRELITNSVNDVLFCSREGQLLKKLFDIYQSSFQRKKINSYYFYVSRKSTLLPSLDCFDKETFNILFRQFNDISVDDFLKCLGFEEDDIKHISMEVNLDTKKSLNKTNIISFKNKIKNSPYFIEVYEQNRCKQKNLFKEYVYNLIGNSDIHMVDIGWKGTIQDNIKKIFIDEKRNVYGYYLGLIVNGSYKGANSINKKGLLFCDVPKKNYGFDILSRQYIYYEKIFVANHGPVVGYKKDNYNIKPIIDTNRSNLSLYNYVSIYQDRFVDGYKDFIRLSNCMCKFHFEMDDFLINISLYRQCMIKPQLWKFEKEIRRLTFENFGTEEKKKQKKNILRIVLKDLAAVDFVYLIFDKLHLNFLSPIAWLYCIIVYRLNLLKLHNDKGERINNL